MSTAITVQHTLAAPTLEVIPLAMAKRSAEILLAAAIVQITDAVSFDVANRIAVELHATHKEVLAQGEMVKGPLNKLLREVRGCIDLAEQPLEAAKRKLQSQIAKYDAEQKRLIAEAQAKADAERKAAEAAAAAEQKRLQDEANAAAAKLQREREEKAKADAQALEDLIGSPVVAEKVEAVKPVTIAPVKIAAPATIVPVAAESSVVIRKTPKLDVYDLRALAAAYEVGGEVLVESKDAVIRRLLDAGVPVPGARMIMVEQVAQRGVR